MFEFVEKGTIIDIPAETPLSEEQAWKYFRDLVKGIEYCIFTFFDSKTNKFKMLNY